MSKLSTPLELHTAPQQEVEGGTATKNAPLQPLLISGSIRTTEVPTKRSARRRRRRRARRGGSLPTGEASTGARPPHAPPPSRPPHCTAAPWAAEENAAHRPPARKTPPWEAGSDKRWQGRSSSTAEQAAACRAATTEHGGRWGNRGRNEATGRKPGAPQGAAPRPSRRRASKTAELCRSGTGGAGSGSGHAGSAPAGT
jgi:hypothetical protein